MSVGGSGVSVLTLTGRVVGADNHTQILTQTLKIRIWVLMHTYVADTLWTSAAYKNGFSILLKKDFVLQN